MRSCTFSQVVLANMLSIRLQSFHLRQKRRPADFWLPRVDTTEQELGALFLYLLPKQQKEQHVLYDVDLQYLLIYLVSLLGTLGASPEPDAMHPKALRPTNDPVSTQL
jgi:hypothetical protein